MSETCDRPADWDKAVSAAYMRLLGASQEASAKGVGLSRRTLIRYEASDWWPDAQAEADRRWLADVTAATKARLLQTLRESDDLGGLLRVAERLIPDLRPGPTQHDVTVTIQQRIQELSPDELERLEQLPDDELRQELKRLESGD